MDFRWDILVEYAPFFLKGTLLTIGLSIASILIGTILGLIIGLGKMMRNKLLALPFGVYITFFRGTPLLVQILLIHFAVVPLFTGGTNAIAAAIITLSLNAAAYIAEIFRAGIQSIDRGQMEAARSLGMNHVQAMRYIILPQAFKRMIPPLGNEFIVLIKESSLASRRRPRAYVLGTSDARAVFPCLGTLSGGSRYLPCINTYLKLPINSS